MEVGRWVGGYVIGGWIGDVSYIGTSCLTVGNNICSIANIKNIHPKPQNCKIVLGFFFQRNIGQKRRKPKNGKNTTIFSYKQKSFESFRKNRKEKKIVFFEKIFTKLYSKMVGSPTISIS